METNFSLFGLGSSGAENWNRPELFYTQQVARIALGNFEDALSVDGVPIVGQCASQRSLRYGWSTFC